MNLKTEWMEKKYKLKESDYYQIGRYLDDRMSYCEKLKFKSRIQREPGLESGLNELQAIWSSVPQGHDHFEVDNECAFDQLSKRIDLRQV